MAFFNHKERELFHGRHLIGTIVFAAGIINMLSPLFWASKNSLSTTILIGAGASMVGLFFMTAYDGKQVDFSGKRFREYHAILGFKIGEWKSLPAIDRVELLSTEEDVMNEPNGVSPTLTTRIKVHILYVFGKGNTNPEFNLRIRKEKKAQEILDLFKSELVAVD